jgi:GNAT superfamily N-acetyltransferase
MPNKQTHLTDRFQSRVRIAKKSDVPTLLRLNGPVQELHAALYPAQFKRRPDEHEVHKFFDHLVGAQEHAIGIIDSEGEAVGYIWVEVVERPASAFMEVARRVHVHHLSVDQEHRGRGLGSALVSWVEDFARARNIFELTAEHWALNRGAHDFLNHQGFEPVRVMMRRTGSLRESPVSHD